MRHADLQSTGSAGFEMGAAVAVLERTPAVLRSMLEGLPDTWLMANEGPATFSPFDVVGHLLHGERADWLVRAEIILRQGSDRVFQPFDRFAHVHESHGRSMGELLDELAALRAANLSQLASWNPGGAQLSLTGEHPVFGTVTLRQLLAAWVVHDLGHIAQISRVMAKQYRTEVGPWREYLPILDR